MENMTSQNIGKLAEALAKAQANIEGAKEDCTNPFFKSKYADLSSVWNACRNHLSSNGLSVMQTLDTKEGNITLITTLAHSSGEWIRSFIPILLSKQDPQSLGSAITYARRYALSALVGVCPVDDDAETAMQDARRPHQPKSPPIHISAPKTPHSHLSEDEKEEIYVLFMQAMADAPQPERLINYVDICCQRTKDTDSPKKAEDVMKYAIENPEKFLEIYKTWIKKNSVKID